MVEGRPAKNALMDKRHSHERRSLISVYCTRLTERVYNSLVFFCAIRITYHRRVTSLHPTIAKRHYSYHEVVIKTLYRRRQ